MDEKYGTDTGVACFANKQPKMEINNVKYYQLGMMDEDGNIVYHPYIFQEPILENGQDSGKKEDVEYILYVAVSGDQVSIVKEKQRPDIAPEKGAEEGCWQDSANNRYEKGEPKQDSIHVVEKKDDGTEETKTITGSFEAFTKGQSIPYYRKTTVENNTKGVEVYLDFLKDVIIDHIQGDRVDIDVNGGVGAGDGVPEHITAGTLELDALGDIGSEKRPLIIRVPGDVHINSRFGSIFVRNIYSVAMQALIRGFGNIVSDRDFRFMPYGFARLRPETLAGETLTLKEVWGTRSVTIGKHFPSRRHFRFSITRITAPAAKPIKARGIAFRKKATPHNCVRALRRIFSANSAVWKTRNMSQPLASKTPY